MDDPDAPAGTWDHWVVYDLPPDLESLPEGADVSSFGARHGKNSWDIRGYGGPCPPSGTHRYFFRLYALDKVLGESAGETKPSLLRAMEGHVLAQTELMGTYSRDGR
jgi:Raf kinase inhibitor-like YbhB/YbcL family protein